jgi:U3 small nucleolar RNA-associated protein 7
MDALIASAPPLKQSKQRRTPTVHNTVKRGPEKPAIDPSLHSILPTTRTPSSFHDAPFASTSSIKPDASTMKVKDKKLKAKLAREDIARKRAAGERDDVDEYLNTAAHGAIQVDKERGERTWRVTQTDVLNAVGVGARAKKFDLKLENMGEYTLDYTRNGRSLAIASERGHCATFDTTTGALYSEIQLGPGELARDIKFLHSDEFYAVAQRRCVFVYDKNGVEVQ